MQDRNEIFNAVHPQMTCSQQGPTYTSTHMKKDFLHYIEANKKEMEDLVENNLYDCGMSFSDYVSMMHNNVTCAFEITLHILGEMFNVSILVIHSDYLWISQRVEPVKCNIVLV